MLLLGATFRDMNVLSLRIGAPIGKVVGHLINPHNLKVDAVWVKIGGHREPLLIIQQNIREVTPDGLIIDDYTSASETDDLVRLQPIIELHFELLDKKVISGHFSIGKVADYAVDSLDMSIQKLYIKPGLSSVIKSTQLVVDRRQIIEVSQRHIKVSDPKVNAVAQTPLPRRAQTPLEPVSPSSASTIDE